MDRTSATWAPQTGSRTNRRAPPVSERPATSTSSLGAGGPPRSIHATRRRSKATLQDTTRSQNRKRMKRERMLIESLSTVPPTPARVASLAAGRAASPDPATSGEASVCKGKRVSQTKRRKFNGLRGQSGVIFLQKTAGPACKPMFFNTIRYPAIPSVSAAAQGAGMWSTPI